MGQLQDNIQRVVEDIPKESQKEIFVFLQFEVGS